MIRLDHNHPERTNILSSLRDQLHNLRAITGSKPYLEEVFTATRQAIYAAVEVRPPQDQYFKSRMTLDLEETTQPRLKDEP